MVRRVVAGHADGRAVFLADGGPAQTQIFRTMPGTQTSYLWATGPGAEVSRNDEAEGYTDDLASIPPLAATRFLYLQLAPDSVATSGDFDPAAAAEELARLDPEMFAVMESDHPGMHRTDSIDYVIVLDGEVCLELDNQQERLLRPHDVVIQQGTRHAWRNKTDRPVLLGVVMIGARRI